MKKTLLALGATLALAAGAALAQPAPGDQPPPPPFGGHLGGPKGELPKELTKEQFLAHSAQQFDAMDTNHDGKVDRDEMRAFHEKARGKREERREQREGREGRDAPKPR